MCREKKDNAKAVRIKSMQEIQERKEASADAAGTREQKNRNVEETSLQAIAD